VKRREFIAGVGGAAVLPLVARAQQGERMRRICVLMAFNENATKPNLSAFTQTLAGLGWTEGRNVRMDLRWYGVDDTSLILALAQELVGLQPDVILTTLEGAAAVQQETRTIPIVFVSVGDPIAERLNRPGGNATGFAILEASLGGKWLELLSEIAPGLRRVAIMLGPDTGPPPWPFTPSLETAARSLKVALMPAPVYSDVEIETAIMALGREPGGGLVVLPVSLFIPAHYATIILAAARNNVPTVYYSAAYVRNGGLLSYGNDITDTYRRAASYVDRILRGAKPAELPVQLPTKFELVINLKTAKALGLTIPPNLLAIADEVIE
jgi:putative tryptophan/tyrosine transport system substrate-binding protein